MEEDQEFFDLNTIRSDHQKVDLNTDLKSIYLIYILIYLID